MQRFTILRPAKAGKAIVSAGGPGGTVNGSNQQSRLDVNGPVWVPLAMLGSPVPMRPDVR